MARSISFLRYLTLACALGFGLSACTVTETVKDILSSTTPGDWYSGDGQLKADQKVNAFVALNFENLKQDMAQGHGEYLISLSQLLGVSPARREVFYSYAQSRYPLMNTGPSGSSDVGAFLALDRLHESSQP